jgi:hypothetical protein
MVTSDLRTPEDGMPPSEMTVRHAECNRWDEQLCADDIDGVSIAVRVSYLPLPTLNALCQGSVYQKEAQNCPGRGLEPATAGSSTFIIIRRLPVNVPAGA